ncbi:MAG TPA: aldo/keto reductase [Propionibacteriaceae bacterium]|nr:aldo/keto reductase [Propionibacteriaceae bacterium]
MQYTHLGKAGAKVSRLCLGTMNFGWHTDEATSGQIMDAALDAGVNFFDTADIYGAGASESVIGRWFADDATRRDQVVLATKLYIGFDDKPNSGGLTAVHIRKAAEDSLRRLGTDHIDLYQFHHVDRNVRWEEIWEASDRLVRDGKVLYMGSSNFAGWDLTLANEKASDRNMFGLVTEQSVYNLMERTIELEVIPAARHYGMGILPWSPLGGGLLAGPGSSSGRRKDGSDTLGHSARTARIASLRESIPAFEALASELETTPSNLALAWLLAQPQVTAPVLGPRTLEQFTSSLPSLDLTLSDAHLARLDELFPGPGGEAPDAYTW